MTGPHTPSPYSRSTAKYHSPYCEATGPIVVEGTVAARIQALQNASRNSQEVVLSHAPVTPHPPCRLISNWRPNSALEFRSFVKRKLSTSDAQVVDYFQYKLPVRPEEVVPDIVRNKSLTFGGSAIRGRKTPVPEQRSENSTDWDNIPSDATTKEVLTDHIPRQDPSGFSSQDSWNASGQISAKDTARGRCASPGSSISRQTTQIKAEEETWLNKRPTLRHVSSDRELDTTRPVRQRMSIVEQIGEMIDRALEGRNDLIRSIASRSSLPEFSGTGEIRRLSQADRSRYTQQFTESPAAISPSIRQADPLRDRNTSSDPEQRPTVTEAESYGSTRYRESYRSIEHYETPTHQPRQRASTYTIGRPVRCDDEHPVPTPGFERSVSSPLAISQEKLSCRNDRYEVFIRELASRKKQSSVLKNKVRRPSTRTYASDTPRPPLKHFNGQSQSRGSSYKKWKWWKFVIADSSLTPREGSGVKVEPKEASIWSSGKHPLANYGKEDRKAYDKNGLVERLERACAGEERGRRPTPVRPYSAHGKKSSARTTHTLAQCGHEEDEDAEPLELSGDGSLDIFPSTPTSASGTTTQHGSSKPQAEIKIISRGFSTKLEIMTSSSQKRRPSRVTRSIRGMKVMITVANGLESIIKVQIRPKRR
ncbi:hypothetical protein MMC13_006183 [Lambiella insularis]|nr:hypothetical protein [Lambiella insularis]